MSIPSQILSQMGYPAPVSVTQFPNEEEGGFYQVWRVDYPGGSYVLKKAKGTEKALYSTYFSEACSYAPRLIASASLDRDDYLLLEYIPGNNLMRCSRDSLTRTLDALIAMQDRYWGANMPQQALTSRRNRQQYLSDRRLEQAYSAFLEDCCAVPATLCHDDLLPFNVIDRGNRAVFIDWEVGGILPYPAPLARLIAHAEEKEDALFFMTEADKDFAVSYYFDRFIKGKGISYAAYSRSLELTLFYEYCEWVYVGNKWGDTGSERFRTYYQKATGLAAKLGF